MTTESKRLSIKSGGNEDTNPRSPKMDILTFYTILLERDNLAMDQIAHLSINSKMFIILSIFSHYKRKFNDCKREDTELNSFKSNPNQNQIENILRYFCAQKADIAVLPYSPNVQ